MQSPRDHSKIYYTVPGDFTSVPCVYKCTITQALTGGAVEVPTLDGRKINIPINEIVR